MKVGNNRLLGGLVLSLIASTLSLSPASCDEELIPGHVAKTKIERVALGINWESDLEKAKERAKRENKMILWVNMIGKMEGAT